MGPTHTRGAVDGRTDAAAARARAQGRAGAVSPGRQADAEGLLRALAAAEGLEAEGFEGGVVAAAEAASGLHAGALLAGLDPGAVATPPCPWPDSERRLRAWEAGFRWGLALAVLVADGAPPRGALLHVPVEAGGVCFFHATCVFLGGLGEALRGRAVRALREWWGRPCLEARGLAGHAGMTVGEALAAEHGVALEGPEAYGAYMAARDARGDVPQATAVEMVAVATLEGRAVVACTRVGEDGGVF